MPRHAVLFTLLTHLEKQLLSINNDKIESKFKDRNEINYEAAGTALFFFPFYDPLLIIMDYLKSSP